MMPFFALILVESRLLRKARELEKEIGKENIEEFVEIFRDEALGYNDILIREELNQTYLNSFCKGWCLTNNLHV